MKLTIFIILFFCKIISFAQTPLTIKVKKDTIKPKNEMYTDSIFFDGQENSLYSMTSGYKNRFNTLKHCNVLYTSKRKSGTIALRKNKLSQAIDDLFYVKTKKMEIKFTDIILRSDSLNANERKCPPLTITIYKKRDFHFYFGPRGRIISPIPMWRTLQTTIDYK